MSYASGCGLAYTDAIVLVLVVVLDLERPNRL
jgi:hypothetical protein